MYNLIFNPPLFYDIPEYISIVTSHGFWLSLTMGHFPIHPIFIGVLWILIKFLPVNMIAMVFGAASTVFVYKISRLIFKKVGAVLSTAIFLLFPVVWIVNTNLMVESITMTFFVTSLYFFLVKNKNLFFISIFLMVGAHLQAIFWIPTIFLTPFIFGFKFNKKEITGFIKIASLSLLLSLIFYFVLYKLGGREIGGTTEQLDAYLSGGFLRMMRNLWLSFYTDFGSLTAFILGFVFFKKVSAKPQIISWILFLASVALIGVNWQGDLMGRRIIFAAPILAITFYKYLKKYSFLLVLYLTPIVIANIFLYSQPTPFVKPDIPPNEVLIETHYLHPFTKYDGLILWIGGDDLGRIDGYLRGGKRVFLTKQAVTAPYRLLVGQNYHITSLGRIGDSESRFLFQRYSIEAFSNVYELKLFNGKVSANAGSAVISYDQSFWGRLTRRRIDYGDLGTWIWAVVTNHRDPTGWTYKDVRGIWYNI